MNIIKSGFDFNYSIGFVICLIIFSAFYWYLKSQHLKTGESISKKKIFCGVVLSIYITFLVGGTLLGRTIGEKRAIELVLFWSYREVFATQNKELALQMFYNVIAFIPWGMLFSETCIKMHNIRWNIGSAAFFSFLIEVIQFVFGLGLFEFDDIFHNSLGAIIGYMIWLMKRKLKKA